MCTPICDDARPTAFVERLRLCGDVTVSIVSLWRCMMTLMCLALAADSMDDLPTTAVSPEIVGAHSSAQMCACW
jgi:hypothetical protein